LNAGAATIVAFSALLMSRWLDASATAASFALLKLAHFDAEEKEKVDNFFFKFFTNSETLFFCFKEHGTDPIPDIQGDSIFLTFEKLV
jgi:hypothetical protein